MAAAGAVLALTLAACGSGDDAGDSAGAVTSATAAGDIGDSADAVTSPPTSDGTAAPATSPATEEATAPAPTDAVVVPDILQFSAPLVGGGTFDGAAVAGIPTAFWFWAPT